MTVRNIFEVLSVGDEARESRESEFGEKESRDTLQDGACFESVLPHVNNKALKTKLARQKDSPPRGKFTNRFKQSLQDVVQTETISVNGWEEELDTPVAKHPIASLGNFGAVKHGSSSGARRGRVLLETCIEYCGFWSNQQCCAS